MECISGNEVVVINGFSLFVGSQVNVKNVEYLTAICGFLSHLHHAGAVAVLFLLESAMLAVSSQPTTRPPQECVCSCVRACVCVRGRMCVCVFA